eukprot:scaffold26033_cov78-Phaeocystis_antarctica.AAC.2
MLRTLLPRLVRSPLTRLAPSRALRRPAAATATAAADLRRHLLTPRLGPLVLLRRAADRDAQRRALPLLRAAPVRLRRCRLPCPAVRLRLR